MTALSDREVHFAWGTPEGLASASHHDVTIIVDVLSFSSGVEIATARGAQIYPYPFRDHRALTYARVRSARLARRRSRHALSLSLQSLAQIRPGTRLVLPSPNGATLSTRVTSPVVLIGCLRNATAVAEHANRAGQRICVLAAGERTAGALRFALEDLLGAGAVIAALQGRRTPEAEYACAQYRPFRAILDAAIRLTPSGLELIARGFDADVGLAAELDVSAVVPELFDGSFSDHHLVDRCVNN